MNPGQNEEIAKKIQDILDQGLIRKSIIPCAIHTILEPTK